MAHIYMHFDFGADEAKAQQARHKLDVWKQAFRLDKKLQYKLDRPEPEEEDADEQDAAEDGKNPKSNSEGSSRKAAKIDADSGGNGSGNVSLLVRLYFSSHERLSEQRWIERIPSEEPFKDASPRILRQGEPGFDGAVKQFADLN